MTSILGFTDVKQTYFLWLWLDTLLDTYWNRLQDGGSSQTGFVANLNANSLRQGMNLMQLELPMFLMASQFNISYSYNVTNNGMDCLTFYMNVLQWPSETSNALCNDTTNTFNFVYNPNNYQGYIKTCVALSSVFLYGNKFNTANAGYYQRFFQLTGWNAFQIT